MNQKRHEFQNTVKSHKAIRDAITYVLIPQSRINANRDGTGPYGINILHAPCVLQNDVLVALSFPYMNVSLVYDQENDVVGCRPTP